MSSTARPDKPVVFFDGVCGLCNRAVDFILRTDRDFKLYVAPLQGNMARELLPEQHLNSLDTIVLLNKSGIMLKSEAIFEILSMTRSNWKWLRMFRFLPRSFLDWVYDIIANNRYRVFGKKDSCRLPTVEERARFLD